MAVMAEFIVPCAPLQNAGRADMLYDVQAMMSQLEALEPGAGGTQRVSHKGMVPQEYIAQPIVS